MFRKILLLLKNIKLVNRFFISYSVLVFVVINSWLFSYVTTKELEKNFNELENIISSSQNLSVSADDIFEYVEKNNALIKERSNKITLYLIIVICSVILVTVILVLFMRYNIVLPVNRFTQAAKKFGRGELVQIPYIGNDEIGIASKAFNKMIKDISAAQRALQEELTMIKEMEHQKSEFLLLSAHQLRTPLNGLRWLLEITLAGDLGKLNDQQKHHWQNGLENVDRMIRLVNDLLDIAKAEQMEVQYKLSPASIINVIDDALKTLQIKAQQKQITINVVKSANLPDARIDTEKMKIAFHNLIDNAIKYSPAKSKIEITVNVKGDKILIMIKDHGYGIPKDEQHLVFTKFFRGTNIRKIITNLEDIGVGLGLFIVKDIITKHNGRIWFVSEEGKGTSFFIELPL